MSALAFTLRAPPPQRVDLGALTPSRLAGKSLAEIAALPIHTTRAPLSVGDLFALREGERETLVFEGGAERLDRIGAGLDAGAIRVVGAVGVEAGRGMSGGALTIEGDAGAYAGSGLRGGVLRIGGDASERLGGPLAGETEGMNGGVIHVAGNAGPRAGDRLRRGFVLIEGAAGDCAGSRMIAGTLAIGGKAGALPGYLMNRGSILIAGGCEQMAPSFGDCGVHALTATRLIAAYVEGFSPALAAAFRRPLRRYAGDLAALGKGEIFSTTI
ncbi:MAG: formylmethanofuran dehydrogenase subunit C [Pseudomonadota bacterium]|nr:formylmethanofuran dehydrogenase subunit C [Pseudomonadota bacterium]